MSNEKEFNRLTEKYNMLCEAYQEKEKECSKSGLSWDDFVNETRPLKTSIFELEKEIRKVQPVGYEVAEKWKGKIITLEEFIKDAKEGTINDTTAIYYYSDGNTKTDVRVYPSDVLAEMLRDDLTHVMVIDNQTA